jgi:hypothetical protein
MRMLNTLFVCLLVAGALAAFAGNTYRVTLYQESIVGETALKAGEYRMTVENNQLVISNGARKATAAVSVESAGSTYPTTSIRYFNGDGKYRVKEIRIGGTNTKLVLN